VYIHTHTPKFQKEKPEKNNGSKLESPFSYRCPFFRFHGKLQGLYIWHYMVHGPYPIRNLSESWVTPWKINGWNLQPSPIWKGKWSEPNLQGIMFQPLIFRGFFWLNSFPSIRLQGPRYCQMAEPELKEAKESIFQGVDLLFQGVWESTTGIDRQG